jgi:hypothetical protein
MTVSTIILAVKMLNCCAASNCQALSSAGLEAAEASTAIHEQRLTCDESGCFSARNAIGAATLSGWANRRIGTLSKYRASPFTRARIVGSKERRFRWSRRDAVGGDAVDGEVDRLRLSITSLAKVVQTCPQHNLYEMRARDSKGW